MATFDGKYLKGLIGDVVIRKGKKIQIIQKAPLQVRQTEATKKASGIFGQGSVLAGLIREDLFTLFESNYDGGMINRLNTPVRAVLRQCYSHETGRFSFDADSFNRLAGFEFNKKSLLIDHLWVKPQITYTENRLTISIPEMRIPAQLRFPAYANFCHLKIAVTKIALQHAQKQPPYIHQIEISKTQDHVPAQEFSVEVPGGVFCVAGIGLNYYSLYNHVKTDLNSKTLHPAGIIGAMLTPGSFEMSVPVTTAQSGKLSGWSEAGKLML